MQKTKKQRRNKMKNESYYKRPVRIYFKTKTGKKITRLFYYNEIEKKRKAGTLLGAWSTSTGKSLA
jgi:hypothetical protein